MHNYADQINWEDFRFAFVLAECGTFVQAAAVLEVHHTTVARRLDRLEQQLTTPLFYRHTRGVELTVAGQEMLHTLLQVHVSLQNLGVRLHGYDTALAGPIRITTLAPLLSIISPHLRTFQTKYPQIEFEIILEERGLSLSQGEADIAFRGGSFGSEETVIPIKIATIGFGLYGSKAYFSEHTPPVLLEDLRAHQYVRLTQVPRSFTWIRWLEENVPEPRIGITLNHPEGVYAAVKAGFGLGFLTCTQARQDDDLQQAWPFQPSWQSPLWLLVHRDRYRAAKIQAFIQFAKAVIQPALSTYFADQP